MIQGGCPDGTGMGGPGYCIKGEFAANGVSNDLRHTRGVLSMARAQAMDSAGSQFFIMHKDAPIWMGSTPPSAASWTAWTWWTASPISPAT